MLDVVLFDLDGVIRHFDPIGRTDIERAAGLEAGTLQRVAFAEPVITEVTTGVIDRAEWVRRVGDEIGDRAAAEEWLAIRGAVDPAMRSLLERLAPTPVVVAVLTNGTDTVEDELRTLGIDHLLDRVFNSHHLGVRKPDGEAYRLVIDALGVAAGRVWFTDDTPANVTGAIEAGLIAEPFESASRVEASLRALGVAPSPPSTAERPDDPDEEHR